MKSQSIEEILAKLDEHDAINESTANMLEHIANSIYDVQEFSILISKMGLLNKDKILHLEKIVFLFAGYFVKSLSVNDRRKVKESIRALSDIEIRRSSVLEQFEAKLEKMESRENE